MIMECQEFGGSDILSLRKSRLFLPPSRSEFRIRGPPRSPDIKSNPIFSTRVRRIRVL